MPALSGRTSRSQLPISSLIPLSSPSSLETYTVDSAIDHVGIGSFQYIVLLLAGLGWTAESMEMLLLSFIKQPLQCEWRITDSQAALITTFVAAGMLAGSTLWGIFADRLGRRTSFVVSTFFLFAMGITSALSVNYTMMLISRGLVGFGVGGIPVAFSLLMEFLPSAQRGSWGMSLAFFWAIGAMFESVVAMFILPNFGWRWLIIVSTLPLLVVIVFSFWLSESPRWLAAHGKEEKVKAVLERISRFNRTTLPPGRLDISAAVKHGLEGLEDEGPSVVTSQETTDVESSSHPTTTQELSNREQQRQQDETSAGSDDPFLSHDSLISAQVSPANVDYATGVDIVSDAAAASTDENADEINVSPRTDNVLSGNGENDTGQQPIGDGWTESSSSSSRRRKGGVAEIFRPGARGLATQLGFIWFVCAFVYYGLVMLQPEMISAENAGSRCNYARKECAAEISSETCNVDPICSWATGQGDNNDTCIPTGILHHAHQELNPDDEAPELKGICARKLTRDDFLSTLWASTGEMPGVLIAFVLVDIIGRRPLLGYYYAVMAISAALLMQCSSRTAETANFFVARGAASGAFQAMFLLTNELYPSSIRATAMGIASSIARVGLLVTPFVAQYLYNIYGLIALTIYAGFSAMSLISIILLPVETTGRPLFTSMDELVAALREARLHRNYGEPTFANDPSVNRVVRFFRWKATLDGMAVK